MASDATDTKDLELAQGFARAYREIDEGALHAALAPAARIRLLLPRGFTELEGPGALLAALRELATRWTAEGVEAVQVELLGQNLMQTGRLAFIDQRLRLRSAAGDRSATMVVKHLVAIQDGRIALLDELCSGLMPQTR